MTHDAVLRFLLQVAVLLGAARVLGAVARRLGQPAVVGQLVAGVLLGPSVLGMLAPRTTFSGDALASFALLGALFLMLVTGLETDLRLVRRNARKALALSWSGVGFTLLLGLVLGWTIPDAFLTDPSQRPVFALFLAAALSVCAIPVLASILLDLGLLRRDLGQVLMAAGMSDDLLGWTLLGTVLGLWGHTGADPWNALGGSLLNVAAFLLGSFVLGGLIVRKAIGVVEHSGSGPSRFLTLAVVLTSLWAALSHALGLEPVIGAFVMGILLGQARRLPAEAIRRLEEIALHIFAPVFFAVAGTKVDVTALASPSAAGVAAGVIVVACVGKVGGVYVAARLLRADHWTALAYGAGLNARGALEIIVATIGLQLGILSDTLYASVVLMAIVTSVVAPISLRWLLPRLPTSEEEASRLHLEALEREGSVGQIQRVLVPLRMRADRPEAGLRLIHLLLSRLGSHVSVTLMVVVPQEERRAGLLYLAEQQRLLALATPARHVVGHGKAADAILREAERGYDVLLLGAAEPGTASLVLFNPLVDYLVRSSPCPTLVVRPSGSDQRPPRRILVPSNGTASSKRAAEFAFLLAADGAAEVTILHVLVDVEHPAIDRARVHEWEQRRAADARGIVSRLVDMGRSMGVPTQGLVRTGQDPASEILTVVRELELDLLILGTAVRPGSDQLFLGPRVERLLRESSAPVIISNG